MKSLTIVIPCYNEEVNLQKGVLYKINEFLLRQSFSWEVIVVDDGSSDESVSRIEKFSKSHPKFVLFRNKHQGKARAVIAGVERAIGDAILFADMDQATPIEELDKLLPFLTKNYDVVIGSRNTNRHGAPLLRLFMARGFVFLRRVILGLGNITDTQCGFKLFSKKAALAIFSRLRLYSVKSFVSGPMVTAGFDVEILYLAQKLGYHIKEVPVYWCYVETRRVNPVSESINGFFDMLRLKYYDFKGLYK